MTDTNIKYDVLQTEAQTTISNLLKAAALPGETVFDTVDRLLGATQIDIDFQVDENNYAAFIKALGSHAESYQKLERDIAAESNK